MRKFLLNGALISSVLGIFGTMKQTKDSHRPWRTALIWLGWGISVAISIGAVLDQRDEERAKLIVGHDD